MFIRDVWFFRKSNILEKFFEFQNSKIWNSRQGLFRNFTRIRKRFFVKVSFSKKYFFENWIPKTGMWKNPNAGNSKMLLFGIWISEIWFFEFVKIGCLDFSKNSLCGKFSIITFAGTWDFNFQKNKKPKQCSVELFQVETF